MKKYSEIDLAFVKSYLGIEPDFTLDDEVIETFMQAAHDLVLTSGWTPEQLDSSNVPVLRFLRYVKQEYTGDSGVTNKSGNIDVAYQMLRDSMWSGEL